MMKRIIAGCMTAALSAVLLLAPGVQAAERAQRLETLGTVAAREEVIYSILDGEGAVQSLYAVNILDVTGAGEIDDHGDYTEVTNLTNLRELTYRNGVMTTVADVGKFYYQGTMANKALPWNFSISYSLDGEKVSPSALPGAEGHLDIRIATTCNEDADPTFFAHYMLQVTVTLDTELCENIAAPGGTMANAGSDKMLTFMVLPGQDGRMTVSADVTAFEMAGISFAAVPFSMTFDLGDVSELTAGFTSLADAVQQLDDGITALRDGAEALSGGADALSDGSGEFQAGLQTLSSNSAALTDASAQILGAMQLMDRLLSLPELEEIDRPGLQAAFQALTRLGNALTDAVFGFRQLAERYAQACDAMDAAVAAIPDAALSGETLASLQAANPEQAAALETLIESYQAAQNVRATYAEASGVYAELRGKLTELAEACGSMSDFVNSAHSTMRALLGSDLLSSASEMQSGFHALSDGYAQFHEGLLAYTGGVDQLAAGYTGLNDGAAQLADGTAQLADGVGAYAEGVHTFNISARQIPGLMQTKISALLASFTGGDFAPVSFVSSDNENVRAVQFVIKSADIRADPTPVVEPTPPDETVWTRVRALFAKKDE